jgi:hypothetical protein
MSPLALLAAAPLLLAAGYLTQRVGTCAVAAAAEIAQGHRANRLLGFLLCATVSMAVMLTVDRLGWPVLVMFHAAALQPATMVGAMIFAVGAHLNGRCSLGTLAELAQGRIRGVATIMGMIVGAFAGATALGQTIPMAMTMASAPSPLASLPSLPAIGEALIAALALALLLRQQLRRATAPQFWQPVRAMIANGIITGLLFVTIQRWPYTSLISDAAHGQTVDWPIRLALTMVLMVGAVAGARRGGLFAWALGSPRDWANAFFAGVLMGFGALIIPGGNEALLFTGLPLLLPGPSIAYTVMLVSLVGLALLKPREPNH